MDFFKKVTKAMDRDKVVHNAYFDLTKAFNTIPHLNIVDKLTKLGINLYITNWICSWLTYRIQELRIWETSSTKRLFMSEVSQGSVQGLLFYGIYFSEVKASVKGLWLTKFIGNCKLDAVTASPKTQIPSKKT